MQALESNSQICIQSFTYGGAKNDSKDTKNRSIVSFLILCLIASFILGLFLLA
jgi:hypothetical protein